MSAIVHVRDLDSTEPVCGLALRSFSDDRTVGGFPSPVELDEAGETPCRECVELIGIEVDR